MSYIYQEFDGYKFICNLFAIISRDKAKREIFNETMKNPSSHVNDDVIREYFVNNWYRFSTSVIKRNIETRESILEHYRDKHKEKEEGSELLSKYQDYWKTGTVKGIVADRMETRTPQVAFGIAMTIAIAMEDQYDTDFYIGRDEAKKILFYCLEYFGYQNIEFIPDEYFEEIENLRKLLFSALFSTLLFLYPNKGKLRQTNFEAGKKNIFNVIQSDVDSELFTAFQYVAEAKNVAEQLWGAFDINEQYIYLLNSQKLPMSEFFIVPDIISNGSMGVLTCERGQAIRSLVEGKSGCGKSTLANVIALICQNEISGFEKYQELACILDCQTKMLPVVVNCNELTIDDLEQGIIAVGLRQMLFQTNRANGNISYQHYNECKKYLSAFCNHKIMQEELLVIIDDYSKLQENCIDKFNNLLKDLCRKPTLHLVVITDKLQPSAKFKLSDAFNSRYNEFTLKDTLVDTTYISSVVSICGGNEVSNIKADSFVQMYVNTPRRLMRYAQSLLYNESILALMDSCLEEEIDNRKSYVDFRDDYPEFVRKLTLLALRNRKEKERNISRFTISEKIAKELTDNDERLKKIWKCIKTESIMLERCDVVNSMEFSTPLYFYSVLVDYYLDILQNRCKGAFLEEFSYLSCEEFANVIFLIFCRLYDDDFESVSDASVELFIRAIVSRIFEMETVQDLEYCQWALSYIMTDDYKKLFVHGGNPVRRDRMWRTLKRAFVSLNLCKDAFYECNLLLL